MKHFIKQQIMVEEHYLILYLLFRHAWLLHRHAHLSINATKKVRRRTEIDGNIRLVFNGLSHRSFVLYGSPLHIFVISPLCMRLSIGALTCKWSSIYQSFFRQSPCSPYSPNFFTAKVFLRTVICNCNILLLGKSNVIYLIYSH